MSELGTITAAMIDMHEAGLPSAQSAAMLGLNPTELGVTPAAFADEFSTMVAALIDMHEVGIPADAAMAALLGAIQDDPSLDEVSTVTASMIDSFEAANENADSGSSD